MNGYRRISLLLLAFAALLGVPELCALPIPQHTKNPCTVNLNVSNPDSESLKKESNLGQQLAKIVERSSKIVDDLASTEYLNRLAQNLARNSDARFPIRVKIVDSAVKNELILPGGLLYINDGLILQVESESELAGVLSYGIAYTVLHCGTQEESPSQLMQLGSMPAMIFWPYGWAGYGIFEGMNLAIPLTSLKEQRELVLAVDRAGLKYLSEAGYDPESFVRLLERISPQPGNDQNAFNPFPSPALRLACMREEVAKVFPSRDEAIISSSEFDKVKERLSSHKISDPQPVPPDDSARPILRKPRDP
jgi:beta-barrel assembly-enhancing protease